jgi:16S rRNA (guanine527-N7)-methyltransferase
VITAAPTSEREPTELTSGLHASPAAEPAGLAVSIEAVFGASSAHARQFAHLLVTDGITRGVIGPSEADRIWSRHLFNSAALAAAIPRAGARVVDLGSGAGLPGIPLALARPDLAVVLLEPMNRRAAFLRDCLAALALDQVEIVVGRAEAGITPPADVVVARAVAPLGRLIALAAPLLSDGGILLAMKGSRASAEIAELTPALAARTELIELPAPEAPVTVVRVAYPPVRRGGPSARGGR